MTLNQRRKNRLSMCVTFVFVALASSSLSCAPDGKPKAGRSELDDMSPGSFKNLLCSLRTYRTTLAGLIKDYGSASRKFYLSQGDLLHDRRVQAWEGLATSKHVSRPPETRLVTEVVDGKRQKVTEYKTFLGTYGRHVYRVDDRYEIWIEKNFNDPKTGTFLTRADGVVIEFDRDGKPKRVLVSDPTSRSVDDPLWDRRIRSERGSPAMSRAGDHWADNELRARELKRQIRFHRPDLADLDLDKIVAAKTPDGAFYRTTTDKLLREQKPKPSKSTRKRGSGPRNSGPGAAKTFIGALLVSQAISSLLTPDDVVATQAHESNDAYAKLGLMVRAYVDGDLETAASLRRDWDRGTGLAFADSFAIDDNALKPLVMRRFDVYLDRLREASKDAALCAAECRAAEQQYERRVRELNRRRQEGISSIERELDYAHQEILRRMDRWDDRVSPYARFAKVAPASLPQRQARWSELAEFLKSRERVEKRLRSFREANSAIIERLNRGDIPVNEAQKRVALNLGYAMHLYWSRYASPAVKWAHHGILQDQALGKETLIGLYREDRRRLRRQEPAATEAEKKELNRFWRARDDYHDGPFVEEYRLLYTLYAEETGELARAMRSFPADLSFSTQNMTDLTTGSELSLVLQDSYALLYKIFTLEEDGSVKKRSLRATASFKETLGVEPEPTTEGEPKILAWVNGQRAALEELTQVREGHRLTFLATSSVSSTGEMLVEPFDWGLRRSDVSPGTTPLDATWQLDGGVPAKSLYPSLVFRSEAPGVEASSPLATELSVFLPGGTEQAVPVVFRPNSKVSVCVDAPKVSRVGAPVSLEWHVSDADRFDRIDWSLEIEGAGEEVTGARSITERGNPVDGLTVVTWKRPGTYKIRAVASDGMDELETAYTVSVIENHDPSITLGAVGTVVIGDEFVVSYSASDPDPGDRLVFTLGLPDGVEALGPAECEPRDGGRSCRSRLRASRLGRLAIEVIVEDASGVVDRQTINVSVSAR